MPQTWTPALCQIPGCRHPTQHAPTRGRPRELCPAHEAEALSIALSPPEDLFGQLAAATCPGCLQPLPAAAPGPARRRKRTDARTCSERCRTRLHRLLRRTRQH